MSSGFPLKDAEIQPGILESEPGSLIDSAVHFLFNRFILDGFLITDQEGK